MDIVSIEDLTKHGQGLLAKVVGRKAELAEALEEARSASAGTAQPNPHADDIEKALFAVAGLLTGNLDEINQANAAQLNDWLTTSSVLTATTATGAAAPLSPSEVPSEVPSEGPSEGVDQMTVPEELLAIEHILAKDQAATSP